MKRAAEAQLTRDSADDDDSGSDQPAPWKRASEKELARRNIKPLPKRRGFASSASPAPEESPEPVSSTAAPKAATLPPLNPLPSLGAAAPLPKLGATFTFKPPSPAPATKSLPSFTFGSLGSSTSNPLPASTSSSSGKSKDPAGALKSLLENYRANNTTNLPAGTGDPVKKSPSFGSDGVAKNGKSHTKSSSGTFGLQDTPPPVSKSNSKGKERLSASPPKSPLKSPNDDPYGIPDEVDEIEEDEEEEEDEEDGDWVEADDFANDSGFSQQSFDAEFLADDVDVGLDADREEPYMTFEESSMNAQYKYWIHVRGLNNSFIRAAMKMYREDSTTDLSGLFQQYEGAKRGIERDFIKWAKIAFGEDTIGDEFGTEGYGDEDMVDGAREKQAEDPDVIVIDDDEEDPDKTPPAQPKPKSTSKSPSKSASRSPTVSKSKPPPAPAPAPAASTGFKPPAIATSSFSFGGKVINIDSLSSSGAGSSGGGWKPPAGFTLPSVSTSSSTPAGFGFKPTTTETKPAESAPKPFGFTPSSSSFSIGVTTTTTTTAAPAFSFGSSFSTTDKSKPADSTATKPSNLFGSNPASSLPSFSFPPKPDKPDSSTTTSAPKSPTTSAFGAPSTTSTFKFGSSPQKLPSFGSFPGFGPITGGPPGSPFGTKPADTNSSPDAGDSTKTPGSTKSLGTWPGSTPEASKPGGLFGLSGGFGSGATTSSSGFSFGAPPATTPSKDKDANPFGAPKVPIGGSFDNSNPFHVTTGPTISLNSLGGKERAGLGLPPLGGEALKGTDSGDSEGDGASTPKAEKSRVGIANPWAGAFGSSTSSAPAPSTPPTAPGAGGLKPFTFGMGSKPPSEAPSPAPIGLSGFSFAVPPPLPPAQPAVSASGGAFSFSDPPPTAASKGLNNPFASPPKAPSLFGTGGFSFGSGTTGTGAAAPGGGSAPLFGSAPSFSFGKAPSTLPPFTGTAGLVRGPSGTSSTSAESGPKLATSSQETLLAEPVGEKSASSSSFAGGSQEASAGAGVSQDSDIAPEGGTGLALGEDKYDQPGPGEENEESLFNVRGKIMKFSGTSWADLGIGQIRLYKHKETGAKRVFARNSKSGRIILNFTPFAKMEPKVDDQKAKFMRMTIMDDGKLVKVLVKLKEEKDATDLVKALQQEVDALS